LKNVKVELEKGPFEDNKVKGQEGEKCDGNGLLKQERR
jgi:hypothetical protein